MRSINPFYTTFIHFQAHQQVAQAQPKEFEMGGVPSILSFSYTHKDGKSNVWLMLYHEGTLFLSIIEAKILRFQVIKYVFKYDNEFKDLLKFSLGTWGDARWVRKCCTYWLREHYFGICWHTRPLFLSPLACLIQ